MRRNAKMIREPLFVTQVDASGKMEKIDMSKYSLQIFCQEPGCTNVRYVLPQDRYQVKLCKRCQKLLRLRKRGDFMALVKARQKNEKAAAAAARIVEENKAQNKVE
jgi:hypothetical protein